MTVKVTELNSVMVDDSANGGLTQFPALLPSSFLRPRISNVSNIVV